MDKVEMALELFVEAVELHSDLELLGTSIPEDSKDEVFLIRDLTKAENTEASCIEVSIVEVIKMVSDVDKANEFISVITNERDSIVLHGITRIVGYYSRVNNWNKSKIGELRDRQQKNYALGGQTPEYDEARQDVINNQ
jgi:ribonucleoside-triphosphate reductase